jgi:hypothetical protein
VRDVTARACGGEEGGQAPLSLESTRGHVHSRLRQPLCTAGAHLTAVLACMVGKGPGILVGGLGAN